MNIVLGHTTAELLQEKHVVLELDTFTIENGSKQITAFCVPEDLSFQSLMNIEQIKSLHQGLIKNYKKRNWNYCHQALDYLCGQWDGQLDSFYDTMRARINDLQNQDLDADWDGSIEKK